MRKLSFLVIAMILTAVLYDFYTCVPVEKNINISFLNDKNRRIEKTIILKVRGKYHKNLFCTDTIFYDIEIEGKKYRVFNAKVYHFSFSLDEFREKLQGKPSGAFIMETSSGKDTAKGYIEMDRDCTKVSGVLDGEMFAGPVTTYEEALKVINKR